MPRILTDGSEEFDPDWELPPEPKGEDEYEVMRFYMDTQIGHGIYDSPLWEKLEEWQRESWRREFRDMS